MGALRHCTRSGLAGTRQRPRRTCKGRLARSSEAASGIPSRVARAHFSDLAVLQGKGDSPDESMSIASSGFKLAVVVGGRLDSRKSEEEGRRAGSLEERVRSLRSTARNKSQVGPTAREVRFAGGRSFSRRARRKECSEGSLAISVAGECVATVRMTAERSRGGCGGPAVFFGEVLHFGAELAREVVRVSIIKLSISTSPELLVFCAAEFDQSPQLLSQAIWLGARFLLLELTAAQCFSSRCPQKTRKMRFRFHRVHNVILPFRFLALRAC